MWYFAEVTSGGRAIKESCEESAVTTHFINTKNMPSSTEAKTSFKSAGTTIPLLQPLGWSSTVCHLQISIWLEKCFHQTFASQNE